MKRRLTCRRGFERYKADGLVCAIQLDHVEADEVEHAVITESDERWIDDIGRTIIRRRRDSHYLVGEIANRLYEYEQLGYSPEELKEIVELYKGRKERLNALYGNFAATQSGAWKTCNMDELLKRVVEDTISVKAKVAVLDELNKNKTEVSYVDYCKADVENTMAMYGRMHRMSGPYPWGQHIPEIKDVIFNDPATIVFWADGTKTVVKADKEDFDPEKGLAMAISKKAFGNKGNYFDIFKKWTSKYEPSPSKALLANIGDAAKGYADGLRREPSITRESPRKL